MAEFSWVLHDAAGNDVRTTEPFPTREAAEEWMGDRWSFLLQEGAEEVTLVDSEGKSYYRMGLREA
jgi:hypothetical protein